MQEERQKEVSLHVVYITIVDSNICAKFSLKSRKKLLEKHCIQSAPPFMYSCQIRTIKVALSLYIFLLVMTNTRPSS